MSVFRPAPCPNILRRADAECQKLLLHRRLARPFTEACRCLRRPSHSRIFSPAPLRTRRCVPVIANAASALSQEGERREVWEASSSWSDYPTGRLVAGVAAMLGAERATAAVIKATGSPLPAPVLMLALIGAYMSVGGEQAEQMYDWMHPAITFFDQWMPLFFVPSISNIALAPLPHGLDLAKSAALLGLSYLFTLWASAKVGSFIRKYLIGAKAAGRGKTSSQLSDQEKVERLSTAATLWVKKAAKTGAKALASAALQTDDKDVQKMAVKAASVLGKVSERIQAPKRVPSMPPLPKNSLTMLYAAAAAALLPSLSSPNPNPVTMAPGLLMLSLALFNSAKQLPSRVKVWLGPTLAAGAAMTCIMSAYGTSLGATWQSGIRLYSNGAGAFLSLLIGPAVAALGFKVHSQKALLQQHSADLVLTCLFLTPLQFLAGALIGRVLTVPPLVTASLLPAHTTLGMALGLGPLLHADPGLVVAGVTIAGTTGISTAQNLLDAWKVRDPTTRGLAVGIASHSLGTSALVASEPRSAAVSGLAFALKGTMAVVLISIPAFRQLLLTIAGVPC